MDSTTTQPSKPAGHDWRTAGEAWGHAAADWSTLFEHYAIEVVASIVRSVVPPDGGRLLDIACGSGWAMRHAKASGADVTGIDAAERLVEVARDRHPEAEIVHGSMFELPWENESFDAAMSINGIWGGCEAALAEAHRVLRPGGRIGISFWGKGQPLDLRPFFIAVAGHLDQEHVSGMISINNIANPGVAEQMFEETGFEVTDRGSHVSVLEWPDEDLAWRALRSIGPIVPALAESDPAAIRRDAMDALEHCRTANGGIRFQNTHEFVIAQKIG